MTVAADAFDLTSADYWGDPYRTLGPFASARIRGSVSGIAIGAPSRVELARHDTLPLLAYRSGTLADLIRTPFHHSVVVASRLDAEPAVFAGETVIDDSLPPAAPKVPQPGFGGGSHFIDLRDVLPLPWSPARWLVRVLLQDVQSNAVTIELAKDGVEPGDALQPLALSIDVPRVVLRTSGARCVARVAFEMPLRGSVATLPRVMPVWLVMIGSISGGLVVERLDIPPEELATTTEGPAVTGSLEIDLLRNPLIASSPQTFFVYAFSGASMAGPSLAAIADPAVAE